MQDVGALQAGVYFWAVIQFDPGIDMLRGEFIGLNGGADFYARDIAEGKTHNQEIASTLGAKVFR